MAEKVGKIKRWVVYKSPRDGLKVCRVDVYVDFVRGLQQQIKRGGSMRSEAELGATVLRFPVISMHTTYKEANAMVKLTKE